MVETPLPGAGATAPKIDFRAVAKVAQRVRLRDVRLAWSQVGRYIDFDLVEDDWTLQAFVYYNSQAELGEGSEEVTSPLRVQSSFVLHYFRGVDSRTVDDPPQASEEEPPSLAIEAIFDLEYVLREPEEIDATAINNFAIANATHNAWPYWREFAQSSSTRLGLSAYVAPPFKLPSADDPPKEKAVTNGDQSKPEEEAGDE
jgi:hypothetical protein